MVCGRTQGCSHWLYPPLTRPVRWSARGGCAHAYVHKQTHAPTSAITRVGCGYAHTEWSSNPVFNDKCSPNCGHTPTNTPRHTYVETWGIPFYKQFGKIIHFTNNSAKSSKIRQCGTRYRPGTPDQSALDLLLLSVSRELPMGLPGPPYMCVCVCMCIGGGVGRLKRTWRGL